MERILTTLTTIMPFLLIGNYYNTHQNNPRKLMLEDYDFVFVLSGIPNHRPSGGEDVIYHLCSELHKSGHTIACIVIRNASLYLSEQFHDDSLLSKQTVLDKFHIFLYRSVFYKLEVFKIIRRVKHIPYDFSILNGTDFFFYNKPKDVTQNVKNIIATAWDTADFTSEYVRSHSKSTGFYFIQHSEDDPSYSGRLSAYVSRTYKIQNLKKIVINRGMYKRFEDEDPLRMSIGFDYNSYVYNKEKERTILFPLRKGESKGALYALKVVEILKHTLSDWKFAAYGNYQGKVPDYIEFHYRSDSSKLRNLYSNSRIFFLPSTVEGFSLTAAEAMASGCAVVSTNCGGVDEYLEDRKNGIFVPVNDVDAMVKAITELAMNENLASMFGQNGREAVKKYSYENMYNSFIRLFNNVSEQLNQ